jgi:hypothetical protein
MAVQLKLDGDAVVYGDWNVPMSEIRVIGEFLTQHGRRGSEHFLVFMTKEEWFKAPYDSEGREAFMAELGERLKDELRCDLWKATNFSSRVLWPAHLEGRALFDLITEERSTNVITRIRQMLFQKVDMRFTDEVRRELGHA